jgi:hypothetical protein
MNQQANHFTPTPSSDRFASPARRSRGGYLRGNGATGCSALHSTSDRQFQCLGFYGT